MIHQPNKDFPIVFRYIRNYDEDGNVTAKGGITFVFAIDYINHEVYFGLSVCSMADTFDKSFGRIVALYDLAKYPMAIKDAFENGGLRDTLVGLALDTIDECFDIGWNIEHWIKAAKEYKVLKQKVLDNVVKEDVEEEKHDLVSKAASIAKRIHVGQFDKAGVDYFEGHLTHVASKFEDPVLKTVAYLHDVFEDKSDVSIDNILDELGDSATNEEKKEMHYALKAITKTPFHNSYFDYIQDVAKNPIATQVKIEDLKHNLDVSRLDGAFYRLVDVSKRIGKYEAALEYLESKL